MSFNAWFSVLKMKRIYVIHIFEKKSDNYT